MYVLILKDINSDTITMTDKVFATKTEALNICNKFNKQSNSQKLSIFQLLNNI